MSFLGLLFRSVRNYEVAEMPAKNDFCFTAPGWHSAAGLTLHNDSPAYVLMNAQLTND